MKEPQLSGIAKALAAHGRKGDDMLVHVSRKELAALERMGEGLGIHLTKNPATGLPEAFNWLGALGGVVGGVIGTIIAPGAGTAAGAAIGSAAGTAAGGGTAKQALMAGVIGGITGYVGGAGAGELATAGEQAIAQETLNEGASQIVQQGVGEGVGSGLTSGTADLVSGGVQGGVTDLATNTAANTAASNVTADTLRGSAEYALQGADQFGNLSGQQYGDIVGKGLEKGLTTDQINANLTGANAPFMDKLKAGWDASASASSPFAGQGNTLIKTGVGLATLGSINPGESSIVTPTTATANPYTAEWYTDPATGQQRTRAVKRAAQGGTMFSDYDAADAASDGGYSPGGEVGYATGGIASTAAAKAAPSKDPVNSIYRNSAFDVYAENLAAPITRGNIARETPAVLPKGFFSKAEYAAASPEERAEMDRLMAAREEMLPSPMRRRPDGFANGGIADLGSYSDGGRLLKGPGDGVSDNIPATIEGKRPARLADGEFVVPARAVSELGNGSTEAGSKQLYKMLDRIASKRKKGKGLAYEANPEKLLPA